MHFNCLAVGDPNKLFNIKKYGNNMFHLFIKKVPFLIFWIGLSLFRLSSQEQTTTQGTTGPARMVIAELDRKAEAMKKSIRKTRSDIHISGTTPS